MNLAVAVICCNRPVYLKRCLESVAQIEDRCEVHVFCDKTEASVVDKQRKLVASKLPAAKFHVRQSSYGACKNTNEAHRYLFNMGFSHVLKVEDDAEVSPYVARWCEAVSKWVGGKCLITPTRTPDDVTAEDPKCLERVAAWYPVTFVSEGCWIDAQAYYRQFVKLCEPSYMTRDVKKILAWNASISSLCDLSSDPRLVAWSQVSACQDVAMYLSVLASGGCIVSPRVPRSYTFGTLGMHVTPEMYSRLFAHVRWDLVRKMDVDEDPRDFRWC